MTESLNDRQCPVPDAGGGERVLLAHGEGGRLSRRLIRERLQSKFADNPAEIVCADAAVLGPVDGEIVLTTDSYVVSPLFFPGGDIGSLAVHGTVNDLTVAGAKPLWMSLALILEEGLLLTVLDRVIDSLANAAAACELRIVTGDTKVVPRGAADGLFINVTGVGRMLSPSPPGPASLAVGDVLIVSGPIGGHGMAVMTSREGLQFDVGPVSDSAPLYAAAEALRTAGIPVKAMRDATRGGVAAVLHEWADECGRTLTIEEQRIPVSPAVRGACEVLGLDPVHVANEGTMLIAVPADAAERALAALQSVPVSAAAKAIGEVRDRKSAAVTVVRGLGREFPLDEPLGALLPRIC